MQVLQISKRKTKIFVFTILSLALGFTSSAFAVDLGGYTGANKSSAVRGIEAMCTQAADSIARQPEAEGKILGLLRDGFANIRNRKDGGKGIPEAIGVIRAAAIEGVGRNPTAVVEGKLISLVEECEAELYKLGKLPFNF